MRERKRQDSLQHMPNPCVHKQMSITLTDQVMDICV